MQEIVGMRLQVGTGFVLGEWGAAGRAKTVFTDHIRANRERLRLNTGDKQSHLDQS